MSWVMSQKHSNNNGSAKKISITKCTWFIQEHGKGRLQDGTHSIYGLVPSFPLGLTLELSEELSDPIITWAVSYK